MASGSEHNPVESAELKKDSHVEEELSEKPLKRVEFPLPALNAPENARFLDKFEQPALDEADVVAWIHGDGNWDQSGKIQLLMQEWNAESIRNETLSETPNPFSKSTFDALKDHHWLTDAWLLMWHNDAGGSGSLFQEETARFFLQTPNDGGPFCSLAVASFRYGTGGIFIADDNFQLDSMLSNEEYYVPHFFHDGYSRMDFCLLPILVFEWHVAYTAKQLTNLKKRVSKIEDEVASQQGSANPAHLNSELHRCSSSLLVLDRRWQFELNVAQKLLEYFETFAMNNRHRVGDRGAYYVPSSQQRVKFHLESSKALEYDIGVLPRRIKLQHTAVRNLVDVRIANSTREIAMESRRDASAMKTIAILTLVFLPGAYIAAFFSMSMFNWQARDGEPVSSSYLWVYFAVTIPLTIFVVAMWFWWFRTQENIQQHDIELQRSSCSCPVHAHFSKTDPTDSGEYNHGSSRS